MTTGYIGYSTSENDFPADESSIVAVKSPPLPAGTYAVTPSIEVFALGDDIECWVDNWENLYQAGAASGPDWATLTWTDIVPVAGGSRILIDCADLDGGGPGTEVAVRTARVVAIPLQAEVVQGG
jgi:imidazole glycerol phosphate synthase subunit HisF